MPSANHVLGDRLDAFAEGDRETGQAAPGRLDKALGPLEGPAKRGEGMFMGRTRGYRKVILPASERLIGELVPVQILSATSSTLMGELMLEGVESAGRR